MLSLIIVVELDGVLHDRTKGRLDYACLERLFRFKNEFNCDYVLVSTNEQLLPKLPEQSLKDVFKQRLLSVFSLKRLCELEDCLKNNRSFNDIEANNNVDKISSLDLDVEHNKDLSYPVLIDFCLDPKQVVTPSLPSGLTSEEERLWQYHMPQLLKEHQKFVTFIETLFSTRFEYDRILYPAAVRGWSSETRMQALDAHLEREGYAFVTLWAYVQTLEPNSDVTMHSYIKNVALLHSNYYKFPEGFNASSSLVLSNELLSLDSDENETLKLQRLTDFLNMKLGAMTIAGTPTPPASKVLKSYTSSFKDNPKIEAEIIHRSLLLFQGNGRYSRDLQHRLDRLKLMYLSPLGETLTVFNWRHLLQLELSAHDYNLFAWTYTSNLTKALNYIEEQLFEPRVENALHERFNDFISLFSP